MKRTILLLLLCAAITSLRAQTIEIKGRVTDSANAALQGVSVIIKGSNKGTQTDGQGNFTIKATAPVKLTFSYAGYKSQTITADGRSNLKINLITDYAQGEDVVVIGYQTVKRKDLLASVSSVGAKELKDIPVNSAAEALNGRLAGVTATTSEGSPDAEVRVKIRGGMSITQDNSPLYIIDGVQVENGLSSISPQDIQSIDVLKDAAATAIYGARGGNGVIIITTKGGKPGKLKIGLNAFVGVKWLANSLDVMSPYEFVKYQYERNRLTSDSTTFLKNYGTTWDTLANYKNVDAVDWQDELMGRTGVQQTYNLTASGGTKKTTYSGSYTYNDDKAIILGSSYKRHLLSLKADHKITKNIKLGISGRYNNVNVYGAGVSDENTRFSRLRNAIKYRPFLSTGQDIDDNDPFADGAVGNGLNLINPIQLSTAEYRHKTTEQYNVTANLSYTIIKNLTFKTTLGYDFTKGFDRQFSDSNTNYATTQGGKKPIVVLDSSQRRILTNSNTLTYSLKGLGGGKHDLDFLIGEETYELESHTFGRTVRDFALNTSPDDAFHSLDKGNVILPLRNYKSKYTSLSFFGRVGYSFKDKYLLSFNIRGDGTSKFGPGNKWGVFSAGSVAWRVKQENFLKDVTFINDLKFRAGYGGLGNNRILDYLFLTTFRNDQYLYGLNGTSVAAYNSSSLVNSNLKWESQSNRNIGLDLTILKNTLSLSVDYYENHSKYLLLEVPIASTYGYDKQVQNVGKTLNKGIELQLNATILRKRNNLTWTANFNISHNKNTVKELGPGQTQFFPDASWGVSGQLADYIVKVGAPVGSIYGFVTDGFYTSKDFESYDPVTKKYKLGKGVVNNEAIIGTVMPGSIKFKSLDGDTLVTVDKDRKIIGNPTPKFTGGLNQQFTYKQWDASIFVNFSIGNDVYNANKIELTNGYSNNSNMLKIMEGRYTTTDANGNNVTDLAQLEILNKNAKIWRPLTGTGAFAVHSWAIEDGSFLRINNITVGYTLPVKALARLHMSRLRFYATANNVAVITGYSGYDPEVSVRKSPLTPGLDYSSYPKSRSFVFGVNVLF